MDINAKIDVGNNVTALVEKLAGQIGTTADKVFPWYVQQAQVEGWTTIMALAVALVVFGFVFVILVWKADYEKGNAPAVLSVISGIALAFTVAGVFFDGTEAVRKIQNPSYYAMTMMTRDIGRMVGR